MAKSISFLSRLIVEARKINTRISWPQSSPVCNLRQSSRCSRLEPAADFAISGFRFGINSFDLMTVSAVAERVIDGKLIAAKLFVT
jgi:hypothetical protein